MNARLVWVLSPLLVACGDGAGAPPTPDQGTPFVQIGTGSGAYAPLTDGQEVRITAGPQGGYHVWGALRAGGFNPEDVFIEFRLVRDGVVLAESGYEDDLRPADADGPYQYFGVAVVVLSGDAATIADQPARLEVTLTPVHGEPLTDGRMVRPVCCDASF